MILQSTIPPVSEAFRSGVLEMPAEVVQAGAGEAVLRWGDIPLNGSLMVLSALALLIGIRSLYYILPDLMKCLTMWRWNITAENSARFSRSRDIYGLLCIVPAALLASRYGVFSARFIAAAPEAWRTACVIAMILGYLVLRTIMFGALSRKARDVSGWHAAACAARNLGTLGTITALAVSGVLTLAGAGDSAARYAVIGVAGFFYLLVLGQKAQILRTSCNPFVTFLYLCALEFLPTGLLIAANLCL